MNLLVLSWCVFYSVLSVYEYTISCRENASIFKNRVSFKYQLNLVNILKRWSLNMLSVFFYYLENKQKIKKKWVWIRKLKFFFYINIDQKLTGYKCLKMYNNIL